METVYTYVAQYGDTEVHKIGYSNQPKRRLDELNTHIPKAEIPEISAWQMLLTTKWESLIDAYEFEQSVLYRLSDKRTTGERVKLPTESLREIWERLLADKKRGHDEGMLGLDSTVPQVTADYLGVNLEEFFVISSRGYSTN